MAEATVAICMGSDSDLPVMQGAIDVLDQLEITCEVRVLSAHRTPDRMHEFATTAHERGFRVIIAGAGGAAHLPGMIAGATPLPVVGVPVPSRHLQGLDSLLSIAQMPGGVPVATVSIGGGKNAGLMAARILAASDPEVRARMIAYQKTMHDAVVATDARVRKQFGGE